MTLFVVDASVVIKWFLPEIHTDAARQLLRSSHEFAAPDLLFAELANTIWKKVARRELTESDGHDLVNDLQEIAVETTSCHSLAADAYELAVVARRTVYDAMYLTLAIRLQTRLVTADDRLAHGLAQIPELARYIEHVRAFA